MRDARLLASGLLLAALLLVVRADAHLGAGPAAARASAASAPAASPAPGSPAAAARAAREAKLRALKAESESLATQKKSLLGELRRLDLDRQIKATELEENTAKLAAVNDELTETTARIAETERDLDAAKPAIRERLVRVYKLGRLGYSRLLLSLDDARTFQRTARVVSLLAQRDRDRVERYRQLIATQTVVRARLGTERQEAQRLDAQIKTDQRALAQAMAVRNAMVKNVEEQRGLNAQLLAELTAATDRLNQSVGGLRSLPIGPGKAAGRFDWPVTGNLQTRFGKEVSSRFGTLIARNGVEIAAPEQTPVRAASEGKIVFAATFTGFGRLVIVDHGDRAFSLYGHLNTLAVLPGEAVTRGQVVGTSGVSPTGAPSLYFELRIDGKPVDPVQWLKR
jgi:septal ring factor EnvC (AmiA/AmiB activator)